MGEDSNNHNGNGVAYASTVLLAVLMTVLVWLVLDRVAVTTQSQDVGVQSETTTPETTMNNSEIEESLYEALRDAMPQQEENEAVVVDTKPSIEETPEPQNQQDEESSTRFALQTSQNGVIGNVGLLPSTPVAIITEKTDRKVRYENCTVAFSLPGKQGMPYAITAGHCGEVGDKVYSIPGNGDWKTSKFLGTVRYVSIPNYDTGAGDWGVIRLYRDAALPKPLGEVPMALDTSSVSESTSLCKNGSRTGFTCGIQGEKNIRAILTEDANDKPIIGKLDEIQKICALPGDSGSPVFTDDAIVGVLSSTDASDEASRRGSCDAASSAYYVPIADVLKQIREKIPNIILPNS